MGAITASSLLFRKPELQHVKISNSCRQKKELIFIYPFPGQAGTIEKYSSVIKIC